GTLAHRSHAEFLFSSDAAHPDTRRIHESLDYLEGRATVFHPRCLCAWASTGAGATLAVALGHFVLPPAALQEVHLVCSVGYQGAILNKLSLYSQHEENVTEEPEVATRGCEEAEEHALDLDESEEETGSRDPAQGEFPYRTLHKYPMNNMVTGYASARDMKKYVGELRDFTPGTSGYTVYWIQNEINVYSEVKTKMKRKL
ncbi:TERB2 protein, partial [Columbina picui]|nr:TERB2 protein [Columbina picui]